MISYPAILTEDKTEGGYTVEFPDLSGCITEGETLDEALSYAREVLTLYLESIDSRKLPIPHPSKRNGKNIHWIEPDKKVGFAIWLKINREEQGLSQTKIANRLGVTQQAYQRFENPRKTNPTLSQIVKLENLFGREILKP
ncbi:type II toxin-antitoxin system HicB family antitoxin [Leptospira santarosai]|uniref:type II toxin-antitoxin system HicB family antitoxin n=1 Tax=Leptospira santarosai TaxID=28183 RepID=UPI0024AF1832|nr:type II toxin-antitoxin system HicB family antitoxin [Leptospira santarosai]MDI7226544.1 type II toxin-antitoxin system HicB family antitoxin [Leptospira santarosai]